MSSAAKKDQAKYNWRIPEWIPELEPPVQEKLKLFHDELLRFNRTLSLVSGNTSDRVDHVHFADSIYGWEIIRKRFKGKTLFDIGSGNGFPGLVIGLLDPTVNLTLVESDSRKAEYLRHIISICKMSNVQVLSQRVESLKQGSISDAVMRGFANIPKALLTLRKHLGPKGSIYHFKGPEWSTELAALPQQLCSKWNNEHLGDYYLPESSVHHTIVRSQLI